MPPKTVVKKSEQTKETKKKVVKKEETSGESESENENKSESEDEVVVKKKEVKKQPVKKTSKKVTKKEESEQSESEVEQDQPEPVEQDQHKEVLFEEQNEQNELNQPKWGEELSDNEHNEKNEHNEEKVSSNEQKASFEASKHVQEKPRFNKNNRNDKRFQTQNKTERTERTDRTDRPKSHFKPREENQTEDKGEKTFAKYNMNSGKRVGVNKNSQALKFSYNDYDNVANPVFEVSTEDLIKVLIARSFKEGQMTLKRSLESVLRAMHHECNFPTSNE